MINLESEIHAVMTLKQAIIIRGALTEALKQIERTGNFGGIAPVVAQAFRMIQIAIAVAWPSVADRAHPDGVRIANRILEEVRKTV